MSSNIRSFARIALRLAAIAVAGSALTACQNYTAAPVCTEDNAVVPPGLTGTYTISVQADDFTTQTSEIVVEAAATRNGHAIIKRTADGNEEESLVCEVGGHFIQESFNEAVKGYSQERLYVTGMGLTVLPVFFDRQALTDAGIAAKIIEIPEGVRGVVGTRAAAMLEGAATWLARLGDDEVPTGLYVHNEDVAPAALMRHSLAGPVGVTLLRK
jgi:hypothetical protein